MSQNNLSISSLLDSNTQPSTTAFKIKNTTNRTPLSKLVSKFQTSFDPNEVIPVDDSDSSVILSPQKPIITHKRPLTPKPKFKSTSSNLSDKVKQFQTSFEIDSKPVVIPSKTSINSIINLDDESEKSPQKKRKQVSKPLENKQRKLDSPKLQQSPSIKKKPIIINNATKFLKPGVTSDKSDNNPVVKLSAPTVVDLLNSEEDNSPSPIPEKKQQQQQQQQQQQSHQDSVIPKEKEKVEPPIIALNIPLLDPKDPKPGKAEVVVNILKLAEEKYGWSVMHPKAKSAIEIMDDMIDDDDDEDDEEDEIEDNPRKEVTEELVRQHEIKMVRKVGKYDFEDPFIDDVELQMEEGIASTKEGFFVYWGPLIDDRSSKKKKK